MTERSEVITALRRLKVQTGSLACQGCGYENSCGIRGCAILRAAVEEFRTLRAELEQMAACVYYKPGGLCGYGGDDPANTCVLGPCPHSTPRGG